jgi:hypothetical protein
MTPPKRTNRDAFMASMAPATLTCGAINGRSHSVGARYRLSAILVQVYPPQEGPPQRRHVILQDATGVTGITVWDKDVARLSTGQLGCSVHFANVSVAVFKGNASLVTTKMTTFELDCTNNNATNTWWNLVLQQPIIPIENCSKVADSQFVSFEGILGLITNEEKTAPTGELRILTTCYFATPTGKFAVKGWSLLPDTMTCLNSLADKSVRVRRCRVTSYCNVKLGEFIDGPIGTCVERAENAALEEFWAAEEES